MALHRTTELETMTDPPVQQMSQSPFRTRDWIPLHLQSAVETTVQRGVAAYRFPKIEPQPTQQTETGQDTQAKGNILGFKGARFAAHLQPVRCCQQKPKRSNQVNFNAQR